MTARTGRTALLEDLEEGIAVFESGVRGIPEDRWHDSLWEVLVTDPWVWPQPGTDPAPGRTVESIQAYSMCSAVAAHCAFFLDFYLSGPDPWDVMTPFEPCRDEGFDVDGAVEIPQPIFTREDVLRYIDHGRAKARRLVPELTQESVARVLPAGHPWQGATYERLLQVNAEHVREHGGQIRDAADRWTPRS